MSVSRFISQVFPARVGWLLICCSVLASGCVKSEPARFRLNMVEIERNEISEDNQFEMADLLQAMFGTPDEPFVFEEAGLKQNLLRVAAGPVASDERGRETGLFRRHCAHCHGVTGDGAGPTAAFLNPYPRDYRQGKYKFKSTERPARPTHADLTNVLMEGIPGTAMPSFRLLPAKQIEALVEYVRYLSMRGEMEIQLNAAIFDLSEGDKLDRSREFLIEELLTGVAEAWNSAEDQIIRPDPEFAPKPDRSEAELVASINAGRELFYGKKANCIKCHGDSALGDGQTNDYDDWNKAVKSFADAVPELDPVSLGALPVRTIRPRNLRQGIYRGGRRPLDLYRRVHAGINGVPMPGVGPASPGAKGTLTPQEIWQIVDYVQALPYEPASQPPKVLTNERERQ